MNQSIDDRKWWGERDDCDQECNLLLPYTCIGKNSSLHRGPFTFISVTTELWKSTKSTRVACLSLSSLHVCCSYGRVSFSAFLSPLAPVPVSRYRSMSFGLCRVFLSLDSNFYQRMRDDDKKCKACCLRVIWILNLCLSSIFCTRNTSSGV